MTNHTIFYTFANQSTLLSWNFPAQTQKYYYNIQQNRNTATNL